MRAVRSQAQSHAFGMVLLFRAVMFGKEKDLNQREICCCELIMKVTTTQMMAYMSNNKARIRKHIFSPKLFEKINILKTA